jgi:hypothetical protein
MPRLITKSGLYDKAAIRLPWTNANPALVVPQVGHGNPSTARNVHGGNSMNIGAANRTNKKPRMAKSKISAPRLKEREFGAEGERLVIVGLSARSIL